jgi:alpha-galactosidase
MAKPLKVFILCGQSNMEGHAQTMTFPAIAKDPKTAEMYKLMVDAKGQAVVCDNVRISYTYGDFSGAPVGKKAGKLTAGFGSQHHIGTGKIGPEFTFGIYMQKMLNEPILLIKTAWGGKSLHTDFRSPSAGPDVVNVPTDEKKKAAKKAATGKYYKLMMEHVKEVLADPKSVYPDYDVKEGYELAGFVWFQGFNDLVGPYPRVDPSTGKKSSKDYSEYSRLLACFIRDVRKELSAPKMPFVTGVLGVGGKATNENTVAFRKGMSAPAEMKEFKGNVVNVFTENYWPTELDVLLAKTNEFKNESKRKAKKLKVKEMSREDRQKAQAKIKDEMRANIEKALTKDELFLLDNGMSNQGYHYYGSAKCLGQIGRAFAEALVELKKR